MSYNNNIRYDHCLSPQKRGDAQQSGRTCAESRVDIANQASEAYPACIDMQRECLNSSLTVVAQTPPHSEAKHCDKKQRIEGKFDFDYFDSGEDSPLEVILERETSRYFKPVSIHIIDKGRSICNLHRNNLRIMMEENAGWVIDICNLFLGCLSLEEAIGLYIPTNYFDRLLVLDKGLITMRLSYVHQILLTGLDILSRSVSMESYIVEICTKDDDGIITFYVSICDEHWNVWRYKLSPDGVQSIRTIQCESLPEVTRKELKEFMNEMNPKISLNRVNKKKKKMVSRFFCLRNSLS